MSSATILAAHQLTKTYANGDRELVVLKDVSLSMQAGDACAVVGPSGSGKTTLRGLCAGLDTRSEVGSDETTCTVMIRNGLLSFRLEPCIGQACEPL